MLNFVAFVVLVVNSSGGGGGDCDRIFGGLMCDAIEIRRRLHRQIFQGEFVQMIQKCEFDFNFYSLSLALPQNNSHHAMINLR